MLSEEGEEDTGRERLSFADQFPLETYINEVCPIISDRLILSCPSREQVSLQKLFLINFRNKSWISERDFRLFWC